mmetsp:Transcript_6973/g.11008  ORF Transcript_6973/g.11008 Transcript_6973/m.11008 type:complete len:507 (-) Transcript_6973:731-2251(-)
MQKIRFTDDKKLRLPARPSINSPLSRPLDPKSRLATIKVLKCIEIREGLLEKLHKFVFSNRSSANEGTVLATLVQLLNDLRTATVETVEAICDWRHIAGASSNRFTWNQLNYLVKITSDMGFLASSPFSSILSPPYITNVLLIRLPIVRSPFGEGSFNTTASNSNRNNVAVFVAGSDYTYADEHVRQLEAQRCRFAQLIVQQAERDEQEYKDFVLPGSITPTGDTSESSSDESMSLFPSPRPPSHVRNRDAPLRRRSIPKLNGISKEHRLSISVKSDIMADGSGLRRSMTATFPVSTPSQLTPSTPPLMKPFPHPPMTAPSPTTKSLNASMLLQHPPPLLRVMSQQDIELALADLSFLAELTRRNSLEEVRSDLSLPSAPSSLLSETLNLDKRNNLEFARAGLTSSRSVNSQASLGMPLDHEIDGRVPSREKSLTSLIYTPRLVSRRRNSRHIPLPTEIPGEVPKAAPIPEEGDLKEEDPKEVPSTQSSRPREKSIIDQAQGGEST